jgi:hypothetical protein
MSQDKLLDPFGETTVQATGPSGKGGFLARAGVGLFWLIVLVLLTARIVSYG